MKHKKNFSLNDTNPDFQKLKKLNFKNKPAVDSAVSDTPQTKNIFPYKNDRIFNFSIRDYVPLSYVLQYVDEKINKDENTAKQSSELYFLHTKQWKRYATQYEQSYQQWKGKHDSSKEADIPNLKEAITAIRNYFSHYIHKTDFVTVIFSPYFLEFCDFLQKEALYTFNARFPKENQEHGIFAEIDKRTAQYFADTSYQGSKFFLLLCSILPKSRAMYLLSGLYVFKEFDEMPEQEKAKLAVIKKLLTVLSVADSYNSLNTEQDLVITYSIINYFSQRYADFDGTDKAREELLQSHNPIFIIRSLADIIEANNLLGDIEFARNGEYYQNPEAQKQKERLQPSFKKEDKSHELYINQHGTVIRFIEKTQEYRASLGINALLYIVLYWLKTDKTPCIQLVNAIKNAVRICTANCRTNNLNRLSDNLKLLLPKQILEKQPAAPLNCMELEKAIESKLRAWDLTYFSDKAKPHNKIRFIADWFNALLGKKLNQAQYQELMYHLTAKDFSMQNIQAFLNSFDPQKLSSFFRERTIEALLAKIKHDLFSEFEQAKQNSSALTVLAQKIKLRKAKNKKEYPHKEQYAKHYLANRISPNLAYFKKSLKEKEEILTPSASFSKKKLDLIVFNDEKQNIFNQFYKCKNGNIANSKGFSVYCQEVIVFGAAMKMLLKRFPDQSHTLRFGKNITNNIPILYPINENCKIEILSQHLGRHNVRLDKERMKKLVENYWDKPQNAIIPYHRTKEQENKEGIFCYNDLEIKMETERKILLQAFLQFEKDLAAELGITEKNLSTGYITLKELLKKINYKRNYDDSTIKEICEFRNKAYHSYPLKKFSDVNEPVRTLYRQIEQEKITKRKDTKKIKQKTALTKRKFDK